MYLLTQEHQYRTGVIDLEGRIHLRFVASMLSEMLLIIESDATTSGGELHPY